MAGFSPWSVRVFRGSAAAFLIPGAVLAAMLALAGCTVTPESVNTEPSGTFQEPSPTATSSPSDGPTTSAGGGEFDATGALSEVSCRADDSGFWSFSGTLSNAGLESRTYTIAIAITGPGGVPVLGHALLHETLAAQSTVSVASTHFTETLEPGAVCGFVTSTERKP